MTPSFATSLDALGGWRAALGERLEGLARFLAEHDLAQGEAGEQVRALRERLGNEKLVVAFVAEFSRGKSELINAIFFADTGRRILPATPGRTTMCPVELGWRGDEPASLLLLPIETRLEGLSLGEMRSQPRAWRRLELDVNDADQLAQSLLEVTRTEWVSEEQARALGFWDDDDPDDNPPKDDAGKVEVPAWRHALINYPHPLLKQGLVVLDTPGLNAIGAEPELTLSLLPSAHATVFILGADTGVTKSDLVIWRDHLGAHAPTRFVVLNKIDALEDPLATLEEVEAQIAQQQRETARTLGVAIQRVFPLSARQALAARVGGDDMSLNESRLPLLEAALAAQLLPQRRQVLEQVVQEGAQRIENHVVRHLGDQRRQLAEQTLELRGLRGKNSSKVRLMLKRVEAETAEFEQCTTLLQAMRSVHARMLKDVLVDLSSDRLRDEVAEMQAAMGSGFMHLGARKAFIALCERLRALLAAGQRRNAEIREMLGASFARLNAEFGFSLVVGKPLDFERFASELQLIENNYVQYLGLTLALRLAQPKFMEQFRRMLVSKLRVVFENASSELELWNKAVSAQVDSQLRERRKAFKRRTETLEKVQNAAGELEHRIAEIDDHDRRLQEFQARVGDLAEALREHAFAAPLATDAALVDVDLPLFHDAMPVEEMAQRQA
ncbi:MAG TPA: dynamin family protein [Caldimonas sp.]|nr:dynamin family protein [Caldimonas sp.]HEX4235875.1 dynamin family protein [Caldimonas sp.]